jgi:hypothetical protein
MKELLKSRIKAKPTLFESIISNVKKIDTGFVTLELIDGDFSVILGCYKQMKMKPTVKVLNGNDFCVTMNNVFKKYSNVFDTDIIIKTDTDVFTIFTEKTKEYEFGILAPPYIPLG